MSAPDRSSPLVKTLGTATQKISAAFAAATPFGESSNATAS